MEKESWKDRLKHAWDAFVNMDNRAPLYGQPAGYSSRPDRVRINIANERSILSSVLNRIAVDVAGSEIRHVRLDEEGRYEDDIDSTLNNCLTLEPNLDQDARHLRQDIAYTLFDRGVAVVVPVETTISPNLSGAFEILSLRVGHVVEWFPQHVKVSLYNEKTGRREDLTLDKKFVAVVENPLYAVMNEPNSTLQRLIRKLNLLDSIDEQSASGKLDMIIQLPYVIKSESKREQAIQRRLDIENQLRGSKYGIAYIDGTEKITQLNRPAENNLMAQVEYLMNLLYTQLGVTPEVMNGTADEATMLNYVNRTLVPILDAITLNMKRKFLTKTARSQRQSIEHFRDPFKLVPLSVIAEIADKLTRNEVVSSNDIRRIIGMKPSKDPKANQLRNSNMPESELGNSPSSKPPLRVVPDDGSSVANQ